VLPQSLIDVGGGHTFTLIYSGSHTNSVSLSLSHTHTDVGGGLQTIRHVAPEDFSIDKSVEMKTRLVKTCGDGDTSGQGG